ncbi:MAG: hypothetical protein E7185_04845 [Erysipelotrichaceae bacterium]|nr:hypothetical protein [Erysipelotrichaceae bacterium]
MAELSRTEKYRELRNRLQHDIDDDISTKELSRFERRLNRINSDNFKAPQDYTENTYDAEHAKELPSTDDPIFTETPDIDLGFNSDDIFEQNENHSAFDNDYLDQYIREVKQYNIDQGHAVSDKTSVNVLNQLDATRRVQQAASEPLRPYAREDARPAPAPEPEPEPKKKSPKPQPKPKVEEITNETSDIPYFVPRGGRFSNIENTDRLPVLPSADEEEEDTQTMSKEDIMAEVQSLVNGKRNNPSDRRNDKSYRSHLDSDRTTRQQLLNETTQMRAQLDDYEDNLSEVNDKMNHTNRILNIVLIMLIIALAVILLIVLYWIITVSGA